MDLKLDNSSIEQLQHQNKKWEKDVWIQSNAEWLNIISRHISNNITILDIGSGLGLIDCMIQSKFSECKFILLDKSSAPRVEGNTGLFHKDIDTFSTRTNVFKVTQNFIKFNALNPNSFSYIDVDHNLSEIKNNSVDLAISKKSLGYHYPISIYKELLLNVLRDDQSSVIFDVRKNKLPAVKFTTLYFGKKHNVIQIIKKELKNL